MAINTVPTSSGVTQKVQEFLSTGTFNTPANCTTVELFMVGGGGGGGGGSGSAAGGGGGGVDVVAGGRDVGERRVGGDDGCIRVGVDV